MRRLSIPAGSRGWLTPWLMRSPGGCGVPLSEPVTAAQAKERLILERPAPLDSLAEQLGRERVRKLIEPMIAGDLIVTDATYGNDASYVRDLGLISQGQPIAVANPIYRGNYCPDAQQRHPGSGGG